MKSINKHCSLLYVALACFLFVSKVVIADDEYKNVVKHFSGELDILHADDFLTFDERYFNLKSGGNQPIQFKLNVSALGEDYVKSLSTADVVRIKGFEGKSDSKDVLVNDVSIVSSPASAKRELAETQADVRRIVIMIVDLNSNLRAQCSAADLTASTFTGSQSINGVYRDVSGGRVTFNGDLDGRVGYDIFGPFNLNLGSVTTCDSDSWASKADTMATQSGVNLSLYQHKVYILPNYGTIPCQWAGLGNVGCGTQCRAWITTCDQPSALAHELGHNLGLNHANAIISGVEQPYRDLSCLMGGSGFWREFNQPHKIQLGWTAAANILDLPVIAGTRTYTLSPSELQAPANPQALRTPSQYSGRNYVISYRVAYGNYDTAVSCCMGTYYNKLSIHTHDGYSTTVLITTLGVGESYTDSTKGVTFKLASQDGNTASVQVTFLSGGLDCSASPTVSLSPTTLSSNPAVQKSATVTINNPRPAGCPASTYTLAVTAPQGWTTTMSQTSVSVQPQSSATATLAITPPFSAVAGSYSVGVAATQTGTTTRAQAALTYTVIAVTPTPTPSTSTTTTGSVTTTGSTSTTGSSSGGGSTSTYLPPNTVSGIRVSAWNFPNLELSWQPPTRGTNQCNIAYYKVFLNGALISTPPTPVSPVFSTQLNSIGRYVYTIKAVDCIGQESPASYNFAISLSSSNNIDTPIEDDHIIAPGSASIPMVESFPVNSQSKIQFAFGNGDGASVNVKYFASRDRAQADMEFTVQIDEIIEYVESPGSIAGYQLGEEISIYDPSNIGWADVMMTNETINGNSVLNFHVATADDVIRLYFRISSQMIQTSDVIGPNAVQMELNINNYWFSNDESYLALKMSVSTSDRSVVNVASANSDSDQVLGLASNAEDALEMDNRGFFAWRQKSIIDGQSVPIVWAYTYVQNNVQPDGSDVNHDLIFSFPVAQSNSITMNGRIGIKEATPTTVSGASHLIASVFGFVAAVVAALL